ncbi:MAG TPA: hypothetical protein VK194_11980 [Candidatus Deferrimicrobium sp.]|nr:hypothetical protein [Candidatus Deferrimicrobium sp.]
MSRHRNGVIAAAAVVLALSVAPTAVLGVTRTTITLNSFAVETFTTTGGILCPRGTATTDFHHFGGGPVAGSFHLTKTLVCDDDSGSFTIVVNAATVFGSPTDQGGWAVLDGTDDYASLHGGGDLVGTYVPDGIIDLYTGVVQT